MSFRNEEKIVIQSGEIDKIKFTILTNGGIEAYPGRKISSLYFDNMSLKMFLDSEEGCVPRKKIRVRHYPNTGILNSFNLETKISSVEGRYKKNNKITENEFKIICGKGFFDLDYGHCYPKIIVEYFREYYLLKGQRITLDYGIRFNNYQSNAFFKNYENLIIEIKGDEKFNKDYFQNILPFDRSRFSKYTYAIKKLSLMNLTD